MYEILIIGVDGYAAGEVLQKQHSFMPVEGKAGGLEINAQSGACRLAPCYHTVLKNQAEGGITVTIGEPGERCLRVRSNSWLMVKSVLDAIGVPAAGFMSHLNANRGSAARTIWD